MNHRDLCRYAAGWLLHDCRCFAACYELGVDLGASKAGQVDAMGITLPEPEAAHVAHHRRRVAQAEEYNARRQGLLDGLVAPRWPYEQQFVDVPASRDILIRPMPIPGAPPPLKASLPRIVVIEVKRSRSDLQADLRAQKLRAYEALATNAYLLVTRECFLSGPDHESAPAQTARWLADLDHLGLPPGWGVIEARVHHREAASMSVIRKSRPLREAALEEVRLWGAYMLRSMAYRVCRPGSPVRAEAGG